MLKLPATIVVDYQPYGSFTLANLSLGDYRGHPTLIGTVESGTERGYLFGASSARDITGERREIYGITQAELDRGHLVRIAG